MRAERPHRNTPPWPACMSSGCADADEPFVASGIRSRGGHAVVHVVETGIGADAV